MAASKNQMDDLISDNAGELTEGVVLEYSGEDDLGSVRELVFRSQGVVGFNKQCREQLCGLEILSLSHNNVCSLQSLVKMSGLIELNLNFNNVGSLQGLRLPLLEKLFLSNNKLVTVAGMHTAFPELKVLCLYRNCIADLPGALDVLKGLSQLRELDLDGNPCSFHPSYRHQIVKMLRRLTTLDGDRLQSLDRELAANFFELQSAQQQAGSLATRPSTAPVGGRKSLLSFDVGGGGSRAFDELQRKLPKEKKKLFRSEFLNNHPIMLEYLAAGVLHGETGGDEQMEEVPPVVVASKPSAGGRRSFVDRLRGARGTTMEQADQVIASAGIQMEKKETGTVSVEDNGIVYTNVPSVAETEDPSDPYVTIRKLLQVVDIQQAELAKAKGSCGDIPLSDTQDMVRELDELRVENANMYMIRSENEQLRAQVRTLTQQLRDGGATPADTPTTSGGADASSLGGFSYKLWDENQELKKEIAALRNSQSTQARAARRVKDVRGQDGLYPINETMDDEDDSMVDEDDMDDDAVAALIARNARGLREIREDLHRVAKMEARHRPSHAAEFESRG
jgi:hypothetical protein